MGINPRLRALISRLPSIRFFTQSHAALKNRRRNRPPLTPSSEQREVAKLCLTQNVVVSARPGSGKTAVAEVIAAENPDKRIVVLTYSRRLARETSHRLKKYSNSKVLTFHGLASLLFRRVIYTDAELVEERQNVFNNKKLPWCNLEHFDIVVLDEFQDCTELLFWLVNCFVIANDKKSIGQPAHIVVLGDERQSIHQFRGADQRYLTLAPEILGPLSPYRFAGVQLSKSFRLSNQCVQFINNAFLGGEPYINSVKSGPKPIVLKWNSFHSHTLAKTLLPLIKLHGEQNTVIIAPATRGNDPLRKFVNTLSDTYKVPIYVSIDDSVPMSDRTLFGKLCVSTIHQFKGSERELTILFDINDSFFRYMGRNLPDDRCPNEIFVALTRANNQIVMVHDDNKKLMPFVSLNALCETADIVNITDKQEGMKPPNEPGRPSEEKLCISSAVSVRDTTRYAESSALKEIIQRDLHIREISPPLPESEQICIPNEVLSDSKRKFYETVSDINGLVVAAAFENSLSGTLKTLRVDVKDTSDVVPPIWSERYIPWLCRRACAYVAEATKYVPRRNHMKNHPFNWMAPGDLQLAVGRLEKGVQLLAGQCFEFEASCSRMLTLGDREVIINGQADIIAMSTSPGRRKEKIVDCIWEIKFVSRLSHEDFLQAAMYTYLFATQTNGRLPRTILYNVRNGNKWEISPRDGEAGLQRMTESVLKLRYATTKEISHEEFIDLCKKTTALCVEHGIS